MQKSARDATPARLLATVDLSELGQRLRRARTRRGMTQRDLAAKDISIAYVSRIEAGQRRPDLRLLTRMCRRLDIPVEELLTGMSDTEAERLVLTLQYAELALMSGEAAAAEVELRDALGAMPTGTATPQKQRATWLLARALEAQGQLDEAVGLLEGLRAQPGGPLSTAVALTLCRCYREAGDLSRSIQVGEAALEEVTAGGLGGDDDEVMLTVTVAGAYFERGDVVYATRLCAEALTRAEHRGSPTARASAYWNASIIRSRRGATDEAVRLAQRALALLGEGEDARNLARLRAQLGTMLLRQSPPDVPAAEACLRRARDELAASDGSAVDIAGCDGQIARARLVRGDLDGAETLARDVRALTHDWPLVAADADATLGRVAAARGDMDEAVSRFRAAVATLSAAQADRNAAQLWYELGGLLDQVGDATAARDAYRSAAASLGLQHVDATITAQRPGA